MGIRSTQFIFREFAISRIEKICSIVREKDYRELDKETFEESRTSDAMKRFFREFNPEDYKDIDKWTNQMLGEVMDEPYFRLSMFDNYNVVDNIEEAQND